MSILLQQEKIVTKDDTVPYLDEAEKRDQKETRNSFWVILLHWFKSF